MDQKQPLEVIGNDLVSIQMIPGQKEQKLSKKAKNSQLAITLSSSSEMNSFFVTNDNFCMQKQWPVQKNKLNFFAQKKLDFLVPLLLNESRNFGGKMSKRFCSVFLYPTEPNNTEPKLRYSVNSVRFGPPLLLAKYLPSGHA